MCKINKYLTVKDVLWCGLLKLDVPHKSDAVRFMRRILVVVVRGNQQLGVLGEVNKSKQHRGSADPERRGKNSLSGRGESGPTCGDQSREVITRCFDQCSS